MRSLAARAQATEGSTAAGTQAMPAVRSWMLFTLRVR
jgi:hypothetical protein